MIGSKTEPVKEVNVSNINAFIIWHFIFLYLDNCYIAVKRPIQVLSDHIYLYLICQVYCKSLKVKKFRGCKTK